MMSNDDQQIDLDYSLELHHVNCEEYYWPNSDQRLIPCILFLANTRDRKLYAENVSILSQMYKSLGCYCLKIDYVCPAWMNLLPAFESSFTTCDDLAFELIKIIKENELDYHPIIVHVIGSDGAMIYAKMHSLMRHYIHGAIIESLPSHSPTNQLSTTGSIYELQSQINTDPSRWLSYWRPENERVRRYLTFILSSSYILWHKFYQLFVYRDLQSRLRHMLPDWRELIICEPRNIHLARSILHGRANTAIPKKLLKFPPLRPRRNSIYQQNPRQYEVKVSQFIMSVCDDFVTKYGTIESTTVIDQPISDMVDNQPISFALPSESTIQPMESQSLQSSLVPSELMDPSDPPE